MHGALAARHAAWVQLGDNHTLLDRTLSCLPRAQPANVLLYERIPKAGSSTLKALLKKLAKVNHFKYTSPRSDSYYPKGPCWGGHPAWQQLIDVFAASLTKKQAYINHIFHIPLAAAARAECRCHPLRHEIARVTSHGHIATINWMRDPVNRVISAYNYMLYSPEVSEQYRSVIPLCTEPLIN